MIPSSDIKSQMVLVDDMDNVIGFKEKYSCHRHPVPLHRAISVIIYNNDHTKILLQRRAAAKPTWPLYWSNACCTHPYPNESYLVAAQRRLPDEMGFSTELTEVLRFTYQADYDTVWGEHEFDVVFVGTYEGDVVINPDEASDSKWINVTDLLQELEAQPQQYTPWFKIIMAQLHLKKSR